MIGIYREKRPVGRFLHNRSVVVLALTLGLVVIGATGCGVEVVDRDSLSEQLQEALSESIKVEVGDVNCPSGVRTDSAQRFSCSVEFPDQSVAKVQVRVNPQAEGSSPRISIERFTPEGAEDV